MYKRDLGVSEASQVVFLGSLLHSIWTMRNTEGGRDGKNFLNVSIVQEERVEVRERAFLNVRQVHCNRDNVAVDVL